MIVVDTNVVSYLVIDGPFARSALHLRAKDSDWAAPALLRHEWLNVPTKYIKAALMARDGALRAYRRGLSLVTIDDSPPDPLQVLNLHLKSGCTTYDCQFVALAYRLDTTLVTVDKEVPEFFADTAVHLRTY